jgi:hypothetical protein
MSDIQPGSTVICIRTGQVERGTVVKGFRYRVVAIDFALSTLLLEGMAIWWNMDRFSHTEEAVLPTPTKVVQVPDLSDWRTWARPRPGECACGIPRHTCDYHK